MMQQFEQEVWHSTWIMHAGLMNINDLSMILDQL